MNVTDLENSFTKSKTSWNLSKFKPYDCEKAFIQVSNFPRHQKIHIGKTYCACKKCGKAFSHKSNSINHEKNPCRAKPFECNKCGKAFNQKLKYALFQPAAVHHYYSFWTEILQM
ncbi:Hypothetical predicted protein [Marmota monax]|uniref:C2H2-type domain-containing protein n=1 Tax=Marmota monax TaxID=9995 RepID=A0A5E4AFZ6_MARMO|nr:Hypothetical predicted protein [Marmota monax]